MADYGILYEELLGVILDVYVQATYYYQNTTLYPKCYSIDL